MLLCSPGSEPWLTVAWFNDAIKEGDGNRNVSYFKFFLLVYKAGCHNYCKETISLFLKYHYLFTEWQAQQLNGAELLTQGKPGKNISRDLHIKIFK